MECIEIKNDLLDYLDNNLETERKARFEEHVKECPDCSKILEQFRKLNEKLSGAKSIEPTEGFEHDFYQKLQFEKEKISNRHSFTGLLKETYKVAAAVLLFAGGTIFGLIIQNQRSNKTNLTSLENEVKQLKHYVTLSVLNENTASEKIKAIDFVFEQQQLEKETALALYNTLISDDNSNVRIAAANALHYFSNDETIRKMLMHALIDQNDPYIQAELITIIAKFNNREAYNIIETFINQDNINIEVKNFGQQMIENL